MRITQQKFREIVFQLLYSHDIADADIEEMAPMLAKKLKVSTENVLRAGDKVELIQRKQKEIDEKIREASDEYDFDRIQSVERNVIRLGIFEACYDDEIPAKVAVSEAIRLCRKFSTPSAADFVNAILDKTCLKTSF